MAIDDNTQYSLSGAQVKDLAAKVNNLKTNAGTPTTSTVGTVGQLLADTTNGKLYICTAIVPGTDPDPDTYTWSEVGGSGVNVVQTTGTSTTDVMSQDATTSMVYSDPSARKKIRIGYNSKADYDYQVSIGAPCNINTTTPATAIGYNAYVSGNYSMAIGTDNPRVTADRATALGHNASVTANGGVAVGSGASAQQQGEFNIGSGNIYYGYNNTNYRLLTGVHDPVNAHDAATKGYVDTNTPIITMTSTDPGEGGALAANNFIAVYDAS